MTASPVSLIRYSDHVIVRWDWPPGVDKALITYAEDGFPERPGGQQTVNGAPVQRKSGEQNHEHKIPHKQNGPLFVAIWPDGDGRAGLFATTCSPVTLRWEVGQHSVKVSIDGSVPTTACIPTLRLIHMQRDQRQEIATVRAGQSINVRLISTSGALFLEPQHVGYRSYVHIEPPVISLPETPPVIRLLELLLVAAVETEGRRRDAIFVETQQIVDHIDHAERNDALDWLMRQSEQPQAYYAAVLAAFRVTLKALEVLRNNPPADAAARTSIMDAARDIHTVATEDDNREDAESLLWHMVDNNDFLADDQRTDLLRYLVPIAPWQRLRSRLINDRFPQWLKQVIVEFLVDALYTGQAWRTEEDILNRLRDIATDVKVDSASRLKSVGIIATWAQKRQLKPYRTLDGDHSLPPDDPQHQRERWAYAAAERIAGLDTLFNTLPVSDLRELVGLGRSGSPKLAVTVHRLLSNAPEADVRDALEALLPLFLDTRSSDSKLLGWLMRWVEMTELPLETRASCLDALIATPTQDTDVVSQLTAMAATLLNTGTSVKLRRRALTLIERHHLAGAALDLVNILWDEPDLRAAAVAAWRAAPNVAALRKYLERLRGVADMPMLLSQLVDPALIGKMNEAVNWAEAIAHHRDALRAIDAVAARLEEWCAMYNLPWQREVEVLAPALFMHLSQALEYRISVAKAELAGLYEQRNTAGQAQQQLNNAHAKRIGDLKHERELIISTMKDLERKLSNAETNQQTLKQSLANSEKTVKTLEAELSSVRHMREGTSEARAESAHLEEEIKRTRANVQSLQTKLNNSADFQSTLRTMLEGEKEKLRRSEAAQREAEAEKSWPDPATAALYQQIATLEEAVQRDEKARAGLQPIMDAFTDAQERVTQANQTAAVAKKNWQKAEQAADEEVRKWIVQQRRARVERMEALRNNLAPQQGQEVRGRN